jgi:hypothetical protein
MRSFVLLAVLAAFGCASSANTVDAGSDAPRTANGADVGSLIEVAVDAPEGWLSACGQHVTPEDCDKCGMPSKCAAPQGGDVEGCSLKPEDPEFCCWLDRGYPCLCIDSRWRAQSQCERPRG